MEVLWSGEQVKLASVILLVIISNQKQFHKWGQLKTEIETWISIFFCPDPEI